MTSENAQSEWLEDVAGTVRQVDSRAFLVPPRILRRVIKTDRALPGMGFRIPHRKSYVLSGARVKYFVDKDELGLSAGDDFPAYVFLLSEPKESELPGMTLDDVSRWAWRLLFHARVHFELDRLVESGELPSSRVRACIDRIGQVEFDEIQSVLDREHFLIGRVDRTEVFQEFAAVYWEYKFFAPQRLPWYFPSLTDIDAVESILRNVFDAGKLLDETRVQLPSEAKPGALASADDNGRTAARNPTDEETETAGSQDAVATHGGSPNAGRFMRGKIAADRAATRGNTVRSAILHSRSAAYGNEGEKTQSREETGDQLDQLTGRLHAALDFNDEQTVQWRTVLGELLEQSLHGYWNADRKMLSDLQKACVDHERDVYKIDLIEWAISRGRRPIKRRLPYQREVLIVKHLRGAVARLKSVRISEEHRATLSRLLHSALQTEERALRERMRPVLAGVLEEVGFRPENPPEQASFHKLIEEILDGIVKRGYANMAMLRDAVSRNWLKLNDVSGPNEFLSGDKLLQADRKLSVELDGVYRRGEFYLRWLQRLSSVAFGTKLGRWLTLFVMIPYGGAFMILRFFGHLLEKLPIGMPHLTTWRIILALGTFLLALMHSALFRTIVGKLMTWLLRALGAVLIDMPKWAIRSRTIRALLRSGPVVFLRRFVLVPLVLTILFCFALPALEFYSHPSWMMTGAVYLLLTGVVNSRMGRNVEELTADWVEQTWFQIRTRVFIAMFETVMSAFHKIIEIVERFLYAVGEWLRFRSGESQFKLATKAVFGLVWAVISFVVTFAVTLLIEPQINPIKHFPVVTVSHKIILPMEPMIQAPLEGPLDQATAHLVAFAIVTSIPGIFGFLVWELRSNWRLYLANRPEALRPVIVGDHGESMLRLLKPGFHSGTVPKLFAKIRRAVRKIDKEESAENRLNFPADGSPEPVANAITIPPKYTEAMHHVEHSVKHFVERDFIAILDVTGVLNGRQLHVGHVQPASNSLRVEIELVEDKSNASPLVLLFQEQSGRLIAGIHKAGWLETLEADRRTVVGEALSGLYMQSGVDLVREQIAACIPLEELRYDIEDRSLVVWPDQDYEVEIRYEIEERARLVPRPKAKAREHNLPVVSAEEMVFGQTQITWQKWTDYWTAVGVGRLDAPPVKLEKFVLPSTGQIPAESESAASRDKYSETSNP